MQSFSHEIDWLKARVSQDPASMFYARLADRFLKNNEIDLATEYAEKAALMHPHDVTARFVLAKCSYVEQDFEKAEKNLNDVLALDPQHFGALDLQADLFRGQGATDRVKENLDQLIDLDPLNETVHLKNIAFPEPTQHFAKEKFEDEWNAALLPEEERPAAKFDSELDTGSDFQLDKDVPSDYSEFELDSDVALDKVNNTFDSEQPTEFFKDESALEDTFQEEFLQDRPLHDESLQDESLQDESFQDDPFADFEETPLVDEHPVLEDETPVEHERFSFDEADEQPVDAEEFSREKVLDESIDDDFEIDKSKFREEKSKFTRLLDDIFSSSLDEEEQRENEQRTTIERIADMEPQTDEPAELEHIQSKADDDFEPLMSPEEIIFPEEKILESDRSQHDKFYDFEDQVERAQNDDQPFAQGFDQKNIGLNKDETEPDEFLNSRSEDFSSFLDSLDIQDGSKIEPELPQEFDDPLPKLDDEFSMSEDLKKILEPLSANDDWLQDLSDAASEDFTPSEPSDEAEIEPDPEPIPKVESTAPPVEDRPSKEDKGKLHTPTLGEIYAAQGQYAKAISVYENLLKSEPDNNMYQSKLELLRKKLADQQ